MDSGHRPGIAGESWQRSVRDRLFEQRVVFVTGPLDHPTSGHAAMELMTLDAAGDEPIDLQLECPGGDLDAALSLMDVIELTGVVVRITALGLLSGPAVGVLAVGHRRRAAPHLRVVLSEPAATFEGPARQVERWAQDRQARWELFCGRVAAAVGQAPASVLRDFDVGRSLGAEEALAYGLVDEISRPDPNVLALRPRPMGFSPKP